MAGAELTAPVCPPVNVLLRNSTERERRDRNDLFAFLGMTHFFPSQCSSLEVPSSQSWRIPMPCKREILRM